MGAHLQASHTPGPWRVGNAGVTVFGPPNEYPSPETIATVRKRANATLIAAAPELLAAAFKLLHTLPPTTLKDAHGFDLPEVKALRDAIGKAVLP